MFVDSGVYVDTCGLCVESMLTLKFCVLTVVCVDTDVLCVDNGVYG